MGRWQPDARGRLMQAAFALYGERGFEQTTVAEIAERAGLDRAHVLPPLRRQARGSVRRRTGAAGAADQHGCRRPRLARADRVAAAGLEAIGAFIGEGGDLARQRQAIIASSVELQERELIKLASLASALADALRRRGVEDPAASLTAEAGIAVFKVAFERYVEEGNQLDLPRLIRDSLGELPRLLAPSLAASR